MITFLVRTSPAFLLVHHRYYLMISYVKYQQPITRPFLWRNDNRSTEEIEEEARLQVLESRRYTIRSVLKRAESLKNFRQANNLVPELDPLTNKPIKNDSKTAVTITAFAVAAGAILLRVGGRAALVSAVGLDFANENPELKEQLDQVLATSEAMDPIQKLLLFMAGWTAVKVLCFDAGGVVLALASGILFGGVLQGALASAAAATVGSSVAFGLAKVESPARKKALELLDEYPSLRGIEKVVAKDGIKAILTLRLAPILPIPIGLYNYVYGVTNVPYVDFAGGIFLGSIKPYLLDSYLGYFGKSVVEGDSAVGMQDVLLLGALGLSILVGVLASQLASETWDSVLEEVEADSKQAKAGKETDVEDGLFREFMGVTLPEWIIQFQLALKEAEVRVESLIVEEYQAKVWNYTKSEGGPPTDIDPALTVWSPEKVEAYNGFNFGSTTCDGLVLSPLLFQSFLKYADPFYMEEEVLLRRSIKDKAVTDDNLGKARDDLLQRLDKLRSATTSKIALLDERINSADGQL